MFRVPRFIADDRAGEVTFFVDEEEEGDGTQ